VVCEVPQGAQAPLEHSPGSDVSRDGDENGAHEEPVCVAKSPRVKAEVVNNVSVKTRQRL
jgi:hypothetical protein